MKTRFFHPYLMRDIHVDTDENPFLLFRTTGFEYPASLPYEQLRHECAFEYDIAEVAAIESNQPPWKLASLAVTRIENLFESDLRVTLNGQTTKLSELVSIMKRRHRKAALFLRGVSRIWKNLGEDTFDEQIAPLLKMKIPVIALSTQEPWAIEHIMAEIGKERPYHCIPCDDRSLFGLYQATMEMGTEIFMGSLLEVAAFFIHNDYGIEDELCLSAKCLLYTRNILMDLEAYDGLKYDAGVYRLQSFTSLQRAIIQLLESGHLQTRIYLTQDGKAQHCKEIVPPPLFTNVAKGIMSLDGAMIEKACKNEHTFTETFLLSRPQFWEELDISAQQAVFSLPFHLATVSEILRMTGRLLKDDRFKESANAILEMQKILLNQHFK